MSQPRASVCGFNVACGQLACHQDGAGETDDVDGGGGLPEMASGTVLVSPHLARLEAAGSGARIAQGRIAQGLAAQFRIRLEDIARSHGFLGAVYMHLGHGLGGSSDVEVKFQPCRIAATPGFDEAQYLRRNYLALDPLVVRARSAYAPFSWRLVELTAVTAGSIRLFGVMAEWGMQSGVLIPIQDYARGPALLNLFGPDPGSDTVPEIGNLLAVAVAAHASAQALPSSAEAAGDAMTLREMAVLRLAAMGRTEQETAISLGLSRRGVQFHLARVVEKLGAPNKIAAVARAVSAGLIQV